MSGPAALILAILFLSLAAASTHVSLRTWGRRIAPLGLYNLVWLTSLALLALNVIEYQAVGTRTWLIYLATIVLFDAGCFAARWFSRPPVPLRGAQRPSSSNRTLLLTISALSALALLGFVGYLARLDALVGVASIWDAPAKVRFQETYGGLRRMGWIGLTKSLSTPCAVLTVLAWNGASHAQRRLSVLVIAFGLISAIAGAARTPIFEGACWMLLARFYNPRPADSARHPVNKSAVGVLVLTVTAALVGFFWYTSQSLNKTSVGDYMATNHTGDRTPGVLFEAYHYMVGPLVAFDQLFTSPGLVDEATTGNLTFGAVSRILHEVAPSRFEYPDYVMPFVSTPHRANVYTYLSAYYLDFGIAGLFIMPFLMGFGVTWLFSWAVRTRRWHGAYVISLMGVCILSSTGVNRFGTFQVAVALAFPLIAERVVLWLTPRGQNLHHRVSWY